MKTSKKALTVAKQTLRALTPEHLARAGGAAYSDGICNTGGRQYNTNAGAGCGNIVLPAPPVVAIRPIYLFP
jgi:hypothetical protein